MYILFNPAIIYLGTQWETQSMWWEHSCLPTPLSLSCPLSSSLSLSLNVSLSYSLSLSQVLCLHSTLMNNISC